MTHQDKQPYPNPKDQQEDEQWLDDILLKFAKRIEFMPRGKTYGWEDEKAAILDELKAREPLPSLHSSGHRDDGVDIGLEGYFLNTIAYYTDSPGIPELAAILARYTNSLLAQARKGYPKDPCFFCGRDLVAPKLYTESELAAKVAEALNDFVQPGAVIPYEKINGTKYVELDWILSQLTNTKQEQK